jgi:hypothetical protein
VASQEHVDRLKRGVEVWNEWLEAKREAAHLNTEACHQSDLSEANLSPAHPRLPGSNTSPRLGPGSTAMKA